MVVCWIEIVLDNKNRPRTLDLSHVDFQKRSDSRSTVNNKKCENTKVKVVYACIRLLYLMDW